MRWLVFVLLATACEGEIGLGAIDPDNPDAVDPADYEGATLRIISPESGEFLAYGEQHTFLSELTKPDGEILESELEVAWASSADGAWANTGLAFDDDSIEVGVHNITASVELPNGDRVAYTAGGVLVQAEEAGTYVGTFRASTSFQNFPVACAGAAILIIDPYGEAVDGTADCLASAGGFDLPLDFTIEAELAAGEVEGTASAQIIAFPVEFPTTGTLDGETLNLGFEGDVIGNAFSGSVSADRISRDAGL